MKNIESLKFYASIMTAMVTFAIYMFLMWNFTQKDVLEIIAIYAAFIYLPSAFIPYLIGGDINDAE